MLIWRERPKEESSSSLVTNKLIWYTILFCFSVQVFSIGSPRVFIWPFILTFISLWRQWSMTSVEVISLRSIQRLFGIGSTVWRIELLKSDAKRKVLSRQGHALFNSLEFGKLVVKWNHVTLQAYWMNFWTEKQKRILPNKFGDWWNFESSVYFFYTADS